LPGAFASAGFSARIGSVLPIGCDLPDRLIARGLRLQRPDIEAQPGLAKQPGDA